MPKIGLDYLLQMQYEIWYFITIWLKNMQFCAYLDEPTLDIHRAISDAEFRNSVILQLIWIKAQQVYNSTKKWKNLCEIFNSLLEKLI